MEMTLGTEWEMMFDLVIVECQKPLFHRAENPFYIHEASTKDGRGEKVKSHKDINAFDNKVYLNGNARTLT
jgi:hypothetical protein